MVVLSLVFDEFDAISRRRGGDHHHQTDAGIARDSLVNQLLAKMDGIDPLPVPTLVIGLTNQRHLIDPALLRAGRFEVQIEIPRPRSVEQRISILQIHTKAMYSTGRLLVRDPPEGTVAFRTSRSILQSLPSYPELLEAIARMCDGFTGASLAGIVRAAASRALERAVESNHTHIDDCIVTAEDLKNAFEEVRLIELKDEVTD